MKILFVCLGNICRSPLAHGILEQLASQHGLDWEVDSAGTSGWHDGKPPDHRSIAIARTNGVNIANQQSRKLTKEDIAYFDLIYCMDHQNVQNTLKLCSSQIEEQKVQLIRSAVGGMEADVIDPYYDDESFGPVFEQLLDCCEAIIDKYS